MILERMPERPSASSSRLPELFRAMNWTEVDQFLQEYFDPYPLLTAAASQIHKYFGPSVEADLDVVRDPETGGVPELLVRLETGEDWQSASARLDRFDSGWWLEARSTTESLVTVDIAVH